MNTAYTLSIVAALVVAIVFMARRHRRTMRQINRDLLEVERHLKAITKQRENPQAK